LLFQLLYVLCIAGGALAVVFMGALLHDTSKQVSTTLLQAYVTSCGSAKCRCNRSS
jgi:hypothetical protein